MTMYRLSIVLDDIEGESAEDVAPAIVRWLRDHPDHDVYVNVTDKVTRERTLVLVPGDG